MSNYKFETLQLHVGQENPDPATDARQCRFIRQLLMSFTILLMRAARFGLADSGNIYGRLTNSTQDVLEKRVAATGRRRSGVGSGIRRSGYYIYP